MCDAKKTGPSVSFAFFEASVGVAFAHGFSTELLDENRNAAVSASSTRERDWCPEVGHPGSLVIRLDRGIP